jgi:WD40 repeat protein
MRTPKLVDNPSSLTQHVTSLEPGAHVVGMAWLKTQLAMALTDGRILLQQGQEFTNLIAHSGAAILCCTSDGTQVLTGGDDGRVVVTSPDAGAVEIAMDEKRRWIDAVALSPSGAMAWSAGKTIHARDEKGSVRTWDAPGASQGLCFAPKGYRLAIAHNGGVSLWFPNTKTKPQFLDWKGAHLDVSWSADGRFVVSSMQENALHGWRLGTKVSHMRMTGYPAKPRSLSWSHDGMWLASSGADAVIIWPFQGDGPMGKAPRECGVRRSKVTQTAFHPGAYVVAVGYDDGCILLIRLTDASELLVRPAVKDSGITAFAWDTGGKHLAFGCADGAAGILTLPT